MLTEHSTVAGAAELSAALDQGLTTASILVTESFQRIARANGALGAFVHLDEAGAMSAARASDGRIASGRRIGPLDGIPISVKDNLWVAGMPARWGSRLWADFVPTCDDIVVERLKAAGAIILGKTSMPEFAFSGRSDSLLYGPTRNPWNLQLTPGGSSSGAVASVAAGMTPFAVATDAGGSTRLPASYTGLYGLRPSNGRIPRRHGFPPVALDFQAIGLVARSLEDLETLYRVVAGPDPRDPCSESLDLGAVQSRVGMRVRRLRVGWFANCGNEAVDPEVRRAVAECATLLEKVDCEVVRREAPYDITAIRKIWSAIGAAGVARVAEMHQDCWRSQASAFIVAAAERGLRMSASDYVRALDELAAFRRCVAEQWGDVDAFLCPSAASPAWPLEEPYPALVDGRPGHPMVQNTFATWVNAVGYPGLSVPARPHADGRPLGVQFVGRFGGEEVVLELVRRLNLAASWKTPPFPRW